MVWVETPSNPLLNIVDLRKVAEICHKNSKDIILVVDNTYMTSYFQVL
jgi:cystathionine beta-lyase/cystathionine gamma-synthase